MALGELANRLIKNLKKADVKDKEVVYGRALNRAPGTDYGDRFCVYHALVSNARKLPEEEREKYVALVTKAQLGMVESFRKTQPVYSDALHRATDHFTAVKEVKLEDSRSYETLREFFGDFQELENATKMYMLHHRRSDSGRRVKIPELGIMCGVLLPKGHTPVLAYMRGRRGL